MNTTDPDESRAEISELTEEPIAIEPALPEPTRRGSFVSKVARILVITLILVGGLAWYAYRSTQKIPEFYQSALTAPPDLLDKQGREFESRIFELQHESFDQGQWQAVFTEGQVNGWLATDLPEKFPDAIPRQMVHPRIRITDEGLELAFRCRSRRFNGVVVAAGDAFSTERPNELAIRIKSAKAGIVPIPIAPWVEAITRTLREAGTETIWTEIDGDPTAIIALPRSLTEKEDLRFKLEHVQLTEGQILLGGVTVEARGAAEIEVEEN